MMDTQEDFVPDSVLAPNVPIDENEFCDSNDTVWIRKHPSSGICAAYMTLEDLNHLAGKHQAAAYRSEQIGDNVALVYHTLTRARFVAHAATLSVRQALKINREPSASHSIARINSAGFDQDGCQWISRRPTESLLCVPLSVQELTALHTLYGQLAALATTDADGMKWATCEKKRSTLERQISELDVEAAGPPLSTRKVPKPDANAARTAQSWATVLSAASRQRLNCPASLRRTQTPMTSRTIA